MGGVRFKIAVSLSLPFNIKLYNNRSSPFLPQFVYRFTILVNIIQFANYSSDEVLFGKMLPALHQRPMLEKL